MGETFDWTSSILNDGAKRPCLPEGDYPFKVTNFERGSFPGSAKMGPCPKASLTLDVDGATIHDDLFLHKKMEWRLSEFFRSIGQKKHGEPCPMNWNLVVGSSGMVHIVVTQYTDKNGNTHEINKIGKYLDPILFVDDDDFYDSLEDEEEELPFG